MKDLNLDSKEKPSLLLENILSQALEVGATDVHLETCLSKMRITLRVDGSLQLIGELEEPASQRIPARIKYLAKLKTYIHRQPQDGEISGGNFGFEGYLRVSVYPTVDGEKIALRIFDQHHQKFLLEELGYPPDYLEVLENQLLQPEGLLLFTGPAGSGKTTTIYSALKFILSRNRTNIITIEDPVEFRIPEITQTKVDYAVGLDFPEALRSLLRQDPEVIVIGEIRDNVTAEIAIRAAFTGHLVISTIHAGSVAGTFDRLFEMELEPFLLARSLRLITAQRLVRLRCQQCGGSGCQNCLNSGYRGRMPLVEFVVVDEDLGEKIKGLQLRKSLSSYLRNEKRIRFFQYRAEEIVNSGKTDLREIKRVLGG